MALPSKLRKTIKWSALVLTVLIVVAWVGCCWWTAVWTRGRLSLDFSFGRTTFHWFPGGGLFPDGWQRSHIAQSPGNWRYLFQRPLPGLQTAAAPTQWAIDVPLSYPVILSAAITIILWRNDACLTRRERAHLCPTCSYDRTGLPASTPCPECGTPAHPPPTPST